MRTITAYFDSVQVAEQAAFDLAKGAPGVRGSRANRGTGAAPI